LLNLQEKRNELLRQFTPNHPDVIKMEARIAQVQKQLSLLPLFQEELDHIDREIKTRRDAFFELSRQIEESKIAIDSVLSYVKIVSRARPPLKPWTPLAVIDLPIGMVLGLFMGVFIAFVLESMDISISSIEEIEKVLEAPVLGIIPHFGAPSAWRDFFSRVLRSDSHNEESIRASLVFRHPPKSPQVEAYQNMRVNIQSQLSKSDNIILTFTSTGVSEGKTLTSINFSLAAAHAGLKTLIIGADTRRPNFHRIFGLPKDAGLIEVLKGQIPWQSTLRSMVDLMMGESDLAKMASFPGIDNLKVMTGWCEDTASVPGLFSSPALPALIAEMRPYFNVIVFDCPPLLLFADALLIAPHTDGTVMIYRSGKMARNALKRARDQLVASKGKLVGLVFNDAKAVDMPSGYGDYGDYGHYAQLQKPNPG
ncbi:MAG TPA: hypothetical protein VNB29_09835, partial [Chthoniobacterales bacterium]|nr:hypothetical protein [Chthoniobacterales bacterium]